MRLDLFSYAAKLGRGMTYEQHRQLLALAWCAAVLATLFVFLVYLALR